MAGEGDEPADKPWLDHKQRQTALAELSSHLSAFVKSPFDGKQPEAFWQLEKQFSRALQLSGGYHPILEHKAMEEPPDGTPEYWAEKAHRLRANDLALAKVTSILEGHALETFHDIYTRTTPIKELSFKACFTSVWEAFRKVSYLPKDKETALLFAKLVQVQPTHGDLRLGLRETDRTCRRLTEIGVMMEAKTHKQHLNKALPPEIQQKIVALVYLDATTPGMFLDEALEQIRDWAAEEQANLAIHAQRKFADKQKDRAPTRDGASVVSGIGRGSTSRKRVTCFFCSRSGHVQRNCRFYLKAQAALSDKEPEEKPSKPKEEEANLVDDVQHKTTTDLFELVVDTGATVTIVNDKKLLQDYRPCSTHIGVANGTNMVASLEGSLILEARTVDGTWMPFRVTRALFVQEAPRCLLRPDDVPGCWSVDSQSLTLDDTSLRLEEGPGLPRLMVRPLALEETVNLCVVDELHAAAGHPGHRTMLLLIKEMCGEDKDAFNKAKQQLEDTTCLVCAKHNLKRSGVPAPRQEADIEPGDVICIDIQGKIPVPGPNGEQYIFAITDQTTGYMDTYYLRNKSEACEAFDKFCVDTVLPIRREGPHQRTIVLGDNDSVFKSYNFKVILRKHSLIEFFSPEYVPQHNGRAERTFGVLGNVTSKLLDDAGMANKYWPYAHRHARDLCNWTPRRKLGDISPFQAVTGFSGPPLHMLHTFGAAAYVHDEKVGKKSKFVANADLGIWLGTNQQSSTHRVLVNDKVLNRANVVVLKIPHHKIVKLDEIRAAEREELFDPFLAPLGGGDHVHIDLGDNDSNEDITEQRIKEEEEYDIEVDGGAPARAPGIADEEERGQQPLRRSTRLSGAPTQFQRLEQQGRDLVAKDGTGIPRDDEDDVPPPLEPRQGEAVYFVDAATPKNMRAIIEHDDPEWYTAAEEESQALRELDVIAAIDSHAAERARQEGNVINSLLVIRTKEDGTKRVRIVADGRQQREYDHFNPDKIFAPAVSKEALRVVMAVMCARGRMRPLHNYDVKKAYLNSDKLTEQDMYLRLPTGFPNPFGDDKGQIVQLVRPLYGLRQAGRCWHERISQDLRDGGWTQHVVESCIFTRRQDDNIAVALLYVDDILLISESDKLSAEFENILGAKYKTKRGPAESFLGLQFDQLDDGIFVHQTNYARRVMEQWGYASCNHKVTPMADGMDPSVWAQDKQPDVKIPFRQVVGAARYACDSLRPDLCVSTSMLARHMTCYSEDSWKAAGRMMRYWAGTMDKGLKFNFGLGDVPEIAIWTDASFASGEHQRRSRTGFVMFIGSTPVVWTSKLQHLIATSTAHAELQAVYDGCRTASFVNNLLQDVFDIQTTPMNLFCDSSAAIQIARASGTSRQLRHMEVGLYYAKQCVEQGLIDIKYVNTQDQIADIFTKALPRLKFREHCDKLLISRRDLGHEEHVEEEC